MDRADRALGNRGLGHRRVPDAVVVERQSERGGLGRHDRAARRRRRRLGGDPHLPGAALLDTGPEERRRGARGRRRSRSQTHPTVLDDHGNDGDRTDPGVHDKWTGLGRDAADGDPVGRRDGDPVDHRVRRAVPVLPGDGAQGAAIAARGQFAVTDTREREQPAVLPRWHRLDTAALFARLGTTTAGLGADEAARRRAESGPNELLRADTSSAVALLLGQFKSLIVGILVAAAIASGALGEWLDCAAILAIVVLNGGIGFYQEYSAEKALAALRRMTAPTARVRRGGSSVQVAARDVVPGDVLELEAGDLVPADARLIETASFQTNEAPLTGESSPVEKRAEVLDREDVPLADRVNSVYLGTSVASGRALAVVFDTGMRTEFGRIMDMLATADAGERTPLQERLRALGRVLVWCSLGLVGAIFAIGSLRGMPPLDLFLTSVSLAVAAVPEGLPAIVTVSLALGVQRMARRRALVRRLHAVETLGSTNVICSDKTGTLTVGEMTVRELWVPGRSFAVSGEGYAPAGQITLDGATPVGAARVDLDRLLTVFTGCNGAALQEESGVWKVLGDPTEGALLAAGRKASITPGELDARMPRLFEHPFDSDRKRMSVVRKASDRSALALVKGAPDVLLGLCDRIQRDGRIDTLSAADRAQIGARVEDFASRGMRVLGASQREIAAGEPFTDSAAVERGLTFVGLAGMFDPPRSEAKSAVELAQRAGIRVVMITGDHPRTAEAIARELGIARPSDEVISGAELDRVSDGDLAARVERISTYARVTASHKLRIVRAWKERGAVVAMTGDGVNDAPAIRGADVGIAMGLTGTEVTKAASDMVITDDDFASIVAAVEQGRGTYANIRKTLQYLLGGNVGELLLMTVAVLLGLPLPLDAVQLLWINLVTDGLPALCLATDPIDRDVMAERPRRRTDSITDRGFVGHVLLTGLLTAGVTLGVYAYSLEHFDVELARAHAFATLVYAELLRSFGARSFTKPIWKLGIATNLKLACVVAASIAIQLSLPHIQTLGQVLDVPMMPMSHCAAMLTLGAIPLAVMELLKLWRMREKQP
ncbi:MAG: cation-translocating P-type ATPase [Planctomycetota bacterium]|nr:MAG: cation-translocating P-type ATPase [Planctomycetota bacterium]